MGEPVMDPAILPPTEGELPMEMPAYDIEELKIDIQPMLQ